MRQKIVTRKRGILFLTPRVARLCIEANSPKREAINQPHSSKRAGLFFIFNIN